MFVVFVVDMQLLTDPATATQLLTDPASAMQLLTDPAIPVLLLLSIYTIIFMVSTGRNLY